MSGTGGGDAVCGVVCTTPTTPGYDFSAEDGTLSATGFGVSGVVCATGYAGTVITTACGANGPYSVAGCVALCPVHDGNVNTLECVCPVTGGGGATAVCAAAQTCTAGTEGTDAQCADVSHASAEQGFADMAR